MENQITKPDFLTASEVCDLVQISRSSLWRWSKKGHFPRPRQLGPNKIRWIKQEVLDWLDNLPIADNCEG